MRTHKITLSPIALLSLLILIFPIEITNGFYISHIWILTLLVFCLASVKKIFKRQPYPLYLLLIFIIADSLSFLTRESIPAYFGAELSKLTLLLIGTWIFSILFEQRNLQPLTSKAAIGIITYCLLYLILSADAFTYGGRFQVPNLGSSNTLAVIISFSLLILANDIITTQNKHNLATLIKIVFIIIGLYLIVISGSRGGLFSFSIGLVIVTFHIWKKKWPHALVFFIILATLMTLNSEFIDRFLTVKDGYSSGRVEVWEHLYSSLLSSPSGLLFGFGSGSVNFELFGKTYNSAHSGFLTILYYYGIFSLICFLIFITGLVLKKSRGSDPQKLLKLGILAAFMLTFATDNLFLASQGTIYFAVFIGFVISATPKPTQGKHANTYYSHALTH